jgi:hypothetical protein
VRGPTDHGLDNFVEPREWAIVRNANGGARSWGRTCSRVAKLKYSLIRAAVRPVPPILGEFSYHYSQLEEDFHEDGNFIRWFSLCPLVRHNIHPSNPRYDPLAVAPLLAQGNDDALG